MQTILGIPPAYYALVLEIIILLILLVGWIYGARRMHFKLHHKAVYFVVLAHLLTVGFWMIPQAIDRISIMLSNPIVFWYQIVHDLVGILAIGFGIVLSILFLIKKGMPLKLLKRARPFMFFTIGLWVIAFILGFYWFLLANVLI